MKIGHLVSETGKRLTAVLADRPYLRYVGLAIVLALVITFGFVISRPSPEPAAPAEPTSGVTRRQHPSPTPRPSRERWTAHLPLIARLELSPTPTPSPSPTADREPSGPTPAPTPVNFAAVRDRLQAQGQDLAYVKVGFHAGPGGSARGLGQYLEALGDAGVPAVIKSVGDYGVCAQALRTNPDNVTVFRLTGGDLELPDYGLPAEAAAEQHWARILDALPPDFDQRTWLEVINEPDKERANWLGRFAHHIAQLALRDGYRFAALGWSSGEPEPEDWQTPGMLGFLRLASQHPERIAVALHEYSYSVDDIGKLYPELVGRFQTLFRVCDHHDIPRPTVLITEWGWEYQSVPPVDQAMDDIAWASELYAAYPQVRGAAIWYLGGGYGGIASRAQQLITPLRYYALSEYFVIEPGQKPTDPSSFQP